MPDRFLPFQHSSLPLPPPPLARETAASTLSNRPLPRKSSDLAARHGARVVSLFCSRSSSVDWPLTMRRFNANSVSLSTPSSQSGKWKSRWKAFSFFFHPRIPFRLGGYLIIRTRILEIFGSNLMISYFLVKFYKWLTLKMVS